MPLFFLLYKFTTNSQGEGASGIAVINVGFGPDGPKLTIQPSRCPALRLPRPRLVTDSQTEPARVSSPGPGPAGNTPLLRISSTPHHAGQWRASEAESPGPPASSFHPSRPDKGAPLMSRTSTRICVNPTDAAPWPLEHLPGFICKSLQGCLESQRGRAKCVQGP